MGFQTRRCNWGHDKSHAKNGGKAVSSERKKPYKFLAFTYNKKWTNSRHFNSSKVRRTTSFKPLSL